MLSDQQPHVSLLTSWTAWGAWRDAVVERYRRQGQACPLNVLVSQIGRGTPGAQALTTRLLTQWQDQIAAGIRELQKRGKVARSLDADQSAAAMGAGIQGGVMVMLTTGRLTHLEAAIDVGIAHLRARREVEHGAARSR